MSASVTLSVFTTLTFIVIDSIPIWIMSGSEAAEQSSLLPLCLRLEFANVPFGPQPRNNLGLFLSFVSLNGIYMRLPSLGLTELLHFIFFEPEPERR